MADRFFDTSAAAKHYRAEVGTARVDAFLADAGSRHFLSALSVVELHSVFARLVLSGHISDADFHAVRGRVLADIANGLWQIMPLTAAHYQAAQSLLVKYGLTRSLRTLDALQLAVATSAHASAPLDAFVSADTKLCIIAGLESLTVVNPEIP